MWRFFKPSPLLLLIAASTLQRGNAELECVHDGWLQDESECWADDINRVFGGGMVYCSGGYVSVRSTLWRFLCVAPLVLLCYGLRDLFVFPSCRSLSILLTIFFLSLDICSAYRS